MQISRSQDVTNWKYNLILQRFYILQGGKPEIVDRYWAMCNLWCCVEKLKDIGIYQEKKCAQVEREPSFTDEVNCFNAGKDWNVQCRILSKTCYNIVVCETVDDCFEKHVYNTIYCCTYVCIWEASFPMSTTHFTWQCYSIVLDFFVTERASKKIIRI